MKGHDAEEGGADEEEVEEEAHEGIVYNDDDDDNDDEDDANDEDDEDEDDEENSFLSPMVQVKYGVEYDYDEKKFRLIEGEKLFLISKANEDWWLCLRLEENLTFFVPASYVRELVASRSLKPPPRPPPPPPAVLTKYSSSSESKEHKPRPPQIKQRRLVTKEAPEEKEKVDLSQIYENLANLSTKDLDDEAASNNSLIDSMLEDLDECLEKEERSSFVNNAKSESNSGQFQLSFVNQSSGGGASTVALSKTTPNPDYVCSFVFVKGEKSSFFEK